MKHLDYITDADGILLWFPNQNRTFSVPKPYVFGSETVRFWDGERKRDCLKQILYLSTIHWLIACLTNYRIKSKQFLRLLPKKHYKLNYSSRKNRIFALLVV